MIGLHSMMMSCMGLLMLIAAVCVAADEPTEGHSAAPGDERGLKSMHIEFKTEGGVAHFPGLARPTVIESAQLSESDAHELERLVEAAQFFARSPEETVAPRGAADYQSYVITIDTGRQRHTVRVSDLSADPDLKALVAFLRSKARQQRSTQRTGPDP
jgi:hypothetical protein